MWRWLVPGLCLLAMPALAVQLDLPRSAQETAARDARLEQVAVPTGAFADGVLPTTVVEGAVTRRAYRVGASALTPLQILGPLRTQLDDAGFDILLDCNQMACGGFDFRFSIDVLPAPNMFVNLRSYHFVSARSPDGAGAVMILASAVETGGYLQIIQVGKGDATPQEPTQTGSVSTPVPQPTTPPEGFAAALLETGSAVLQSLQFNVGTTTLGDAPSQELSDLAQLLADRPGLQVALVGHTDTEGGLDVNIRVSRARAQAVRTRLIESYGANGNQIAAEGMGYLAPRASNLTEAGREANRRVEVIVVRENVQ